MVDPYLLELRVALYATAGDYNRARGIYIAAKAAHSPPETVNAAVLTCYTTGENYTTALDTLFDRLTISVQTEARDAEMERVSKLKELLSRELALITLV